MIYALPLLAGILSDRLVGHRNALQFGCLLAILGNILLTIAGHSLFFLGLAIAIAGGAFIKNNTAFLVGSLYDSNEKFKEAGFTWLYLAVNVGGTLGPVCYGLVAYHIGWHFIFLTSAGGIALSAGLFFLMRKHLVADRQTCSLSTYFLMALACGGLAIPFCYPILLDPFLILIFVTGLMYFKKIQRSQKKQSRQRLWALFMLCFFGLFYYAAGMQIGSTITVFIQTKIAAGLLPSRLPGSAFSSLYTLFVLLLAPVLTKMWALLKRNNIDIFVSYKLALGIFLAACGMGCFSAATTVSTHLLLLIVLGNALLSAGELVLTPSIYTAIYNDSPKEMKGTMMGYWLFFVAIGSYVSSILARIFSASFIEVAVFTGVIALCTVVVSPTLKRMLSA